MKVFVIESSNPLDLLDDRNEAESLLKICKMFGHKVRSFFIKSKGDLRNVLRYLSNIEAEEKDLFCYHFSCHGNNDGLEFGSDFLSWEDFFEIIAPLVDNETLKDKFMLIISACGAVEQELTKKFTKLDDEIKGKISPPSYIFIYDEEEVDWQDALLSWTILYHRLGNVKTIRKKDMQDLLEKMKIVEFGNLIYYRWDKNQKKYLRFRPTVE